MWYAEFAFGTNPIELFLGFFCAATTINEEHNRMRKTQLILCVLI